VKIMSKMPMPPQASTGSLPSSSPRLCVKLSPLPCVPLEIRPHPQKPLTFLRAVVGSVCDPEERCRRYQSVADFSFGE